MSETYDAKMLEDNNCVVVIMSKNPYLPDSKIYNNAIDLIKVNL